MQPETIILYNSTFLMNKSYIQEYTRLIHFVALAASINYNTIFEKLLLYFLQVLLIFKGILKVICHSIIFANLNI